MTTRRASASLSKKGLGLMVNKLDNVNLKLSPNVRLRMTFEREMFLDKDEQVFNDGLYQKYLKMYERAALRQEALLKSLMITDGVLALFLSGKDIVIPTTSISIRDFPAALEILMLFSSFGFMFLCLAFANTQAYLAICNQFTIRTAAKYNVDPDFISAADIFTEFHIKLFRSKMNIFGIDFFEAGKGYSFFYSCLSRLMSIAVLSVIALHLSLVGYAIWLSFSFNWISILLSVAACTINVCGILANIAPPFSFRFFGDEEGNINTDLKADNNATTP
ncbi:hypothetical protein ACWF50_09770 [Brucella pseudogrignonensis]